MPVKDGYAASEEIKKLKRNQNIVVVTSYTREEVQDRCLKIGVDDITHKPLPYDIFEKIVLRFVFDLD